MQSNFPENFWTAILCMLFARLREERCERHLIERIPHKDRWDGARNEVLSLSIQTRDGVCRLTDMVPFGSHAEVWMCRDLHKVLEERGSRPPDCSGDPDIWVEDTDNALLIENKTDDDRNPNQEERYIRCLQTAPAFAGKKKAFFYAIPARFLGPGNKFEHEFLAHHDRTVSRGLLLWDDRLKETVTKVLGLQDWFSREFPS